MGDQVYNWLASAGLADTLYEIFKVYGVNEQNFTELQFQDYDAMGILEAPSRQKLFRLIQNVKRELASKPAPSQPAPQPAAVKQPVQASKPAAQAAKPAANAKLSAPSQNAPSSQPSSVRAAPSAVPAFSYPDYENEDGLLDPIQLAAPKRRSAQPQPPQPAAAQDDDEVVEEPDDDAEDDEAAAPTFDGESGEPVSKIRVAVRKRPLNSKERSRNEMDIASAQSANSTIVIHEPKVKVDLTKYVESHKFVFDHVFDDHATNEEIYQVTCRPMINFFLNKGKATCFAYGQTGSGKSWTMFGPPESRCIADGTLVAGPNAGLYILAVRDLYQAINSNPAQFGDLQVWVSFFEIYGGKLFDLLNERKKLVCREDGQKSVNIVGLQEIKCLTEADLLSCIANGNTMRSTGSTGANVDSSRSHAILQITLKRIVKIPGQKPKLKQSGRFSFIDLAGSERGADTANNDRRTRLEGAEINKSLLALKECIRALDQGGKHLPFRGSQLTQVLKDSFMGNSRTIMIANISPNSGSCEHTLNSLRYADRVKELKKGQPGAGSKSAQYDAYMPHRGGQQNRMQLSEDADLSEAMEVKAPEPAKGVKAAPPAAKPSGLKKPSAAAAPSKPAAAPQARATPALDLMQTHQDLASALLREEEQLVDAHRAQIDSTMRSIKEEMELLKKHDNETYSVDEYADKLDELLGKKLFAIEDLRKKLTIFRMNLREEDKLSSSLQRNRSSEYEETGPNEETYNSDDFEQFSPQGQGQGQSQGNNNAGGRYNR